METQTLKVKKLSEDAFVPTRGSSGAAGYDLYSSENSFVEPMNKKLIKTDISVAIPSGHYGRIAPRSGLAHKHFIDVGAGVIDEDYRGNVGVILFNHSRNKFIISKGERIAQLILEKISTPEIEEVEELPSTDRGSGGFGSTGV